MADYKDCYEDLFFEHNSPARQAREEEARRWNDFFGSMTKEELFAYARTESRLVDKMKRHERRLAAATKYMQRHNILGEYLDL